MKSIYDEALKELQAIISEYGMDYYETEHFPKTTKALEQAQKQEKLLGLYKELTLILNDLIIKDLSDLALSGGYYKQKILKIKNEIKELENESKP